MVAFLSKQKSGTLRYKIDKEILLLFVPNKYYYYVIIQK